MIKAEVDGKALPAEQQSESTDELHFSKTVSDILSKEFEQHLSTRAVFIMVELLENEPTADFFRKFAMEKLPVLKKKAAKEPKSVGLQLLIKQLQ